MRTAEAAMFQALSRLAAVCCAKASSRRTETPVIPVHGPEMLRQLSQCSDSCHCPLDLGIPCRRMVMVSLCFRMWQGVEQVRMLSPIGARFGLKS